jgi:hypothetical protein
MIAGGLGSFVFRLPVYDLIERLKVRYARELIRLMLMGEAPGEPRLDVGLSREEALGYEGELARQFLLDRAGYHNCPPMTALVGRLADQGWSGETETELFPHRQGEVDAETRAFRAYLSVALQTILNGQEGAEIPIARCGKIAYALGFLKEVDSILRQAEAEVKYIRPEAGTDQVEAIDWLKQLPPAYRREVAAAAAGLHQQAELLSERLREDRGRSGWREAGAGAQAIYEWLLAREEQIHQWREQMDLVLVRQYIHDDALVDRWYKAYLDDPETRIAALRRLHWLPHPTGGVRLALRTQEDHILSAEGADVEKFAQALLDLAGYLARDIWGRETLAGVLAETALHPERLAATADALWQNSGPLLRYDPFKAPKAVESAVLGVNYTVTQQAEPLAADLRRRLPAERKLMPVDITDPYTLLLARTADVIPLPALPAATEARQAYRVLYGLAPGGRPDPDAWPTAVFAAERNALQYEQRMGRELRQAARVLQPLVVTGLNNLRRAQTYALSYAAGWIRWREPEIWVEAPGVEPFQLVAADDASDPLHPLVLGFVRFVALTPETDVAALETAVAAVEAEVEQRWRGWTRQDWEQEATDLLQSGSADARDLAAVIALTVREEVRRRMARR